MTNPFEPDPVATADREWMDANGIPYTEDGIRRAGALMRHRGAQMTPEAWAVLRRGPHAYTAYLADLVATKRRSPTP
jgi:hypothetical protein